MRNVPQEFCLRCGVGKQQRCAANLTSMPLAVNNPVYRGGVVERFFNNLLPDSDAIRRRIAQHVGANSDTAFDLLEQIGRDCMGALQLTTDTNAPDVRKISGSDINESEIEKILLNTINTPFASQVDQDDFRFSLAGAQEKTALLRVGAKWMRPHGATPTTHILKLPIGEGPQGIDLSASLEIEWLCAQLLGAYGLDTANCSIEHFGNQKVLVVERFDRRLSTDNSWIIRLPQEDLCQAQAQTGMRNTKCKADLELKQ